MVPSQSDPSRRSVLRALTAVTVGTITGLGAEGFFNEHERVQATLTDVPVHGWPPALDGFTIALLTDLHRSELVSRDLIEQAVSRAQAATPDLILLGGDYVTWGDRTYVGPVAESLARLRAPHGVFAILGNHDSDRDVTAALERAGIEVLRDQRTRIRVRAAAVDVVGIRFWTRRASDIASITDRGHSPRVLLAHDPRRLRDAQQLGFPLVLSGHTHGGQVVLPGLGALAARKFPVAAGLLTVGTTTLFVSRGIGTVYVPVRFHCPPEVSLLRLRSPRPAAG
jgi:predicted MPP superfamily phosphohydrolase